MNRRTLFSVIGGLFAGAALPKVVSAGDVSAVASRISATAKLRSDKWVLMFCCGNKNTKKVGNAVLRLYREGISERVLRRMTESMVFRVDSAITDGWRELYAEGLSERTAMKIATTLELNEPQYRRTLEVCGELLRERYKYYAHGKTEAQEACRAIEITVGFKAFRDAEVRLSLSKEQARELVVKELENLLSTQKSEYLRLNDQLTRRYAKKIVG